MKGHLKPPLFSPRLFGTGQRSDFNGMNISKGERLLCVEILQKMVYANNEDNYLLLCDQLKSTELKNIVEYFENNWHDIRKEWVISLQSKFVTLGNRTNNRLESINQKVTQVVSRFSRLDQLFEGLETLLSSLRTERDHKAAAVFSKASLALDSYCETLQQYFQHLTPHSFEFVSSIFDLRNKVVVVEQNAENKVATIKSFLVLSMHG